MSVFTPEQEVRVRMECLKLALGIESRNPQRAIDLAAAFEGQVRSGFATSRLRADGAAE